MILAAEPPQKKDPWMSFKDSISSRRTPQNGIKCYQTHLWTHLRLASKILQDIKHDPILPYSTSGANHYLNPKQWQVSRNNQWSTQQRQANRVQKSLIVSLQKEPAESQHWHKFKIRQNQLYNAYKYHVADFNCL